MEELRVFRLEPADRAVWGPRIAALERGVTYPLGADRFEIDHGADYFAFFDRMGATTYYAVTAGERVVGVGCGVLRRVPRRPGAEPSPAWYCCDLKVHPEFRGRRVAARMMWKGVPVEYPTCGHAYGVTMNPGDGSPNRMVEFARRFKLAPGGVGGTLLFYSLDAATMRRVAPVLREARGPLAYLSLAGVKDIVLRSTGAPMPLLHVQFGPCAAPGLPEPQPGCVHMFCCPTDDPLAEQLLAEGLTASATATVLEHRMKGWDWSFVLTSEI